MLVEKRGCKICKVLCRIVWTDAGPPLSNAATSYLCENKFHEPPVPKAFRSYAKPFRCWQPILCGPEQIIFLA